MGRLGDVLISSALLAFTLPLIAMISLAIKFESPGPVFERKERVRRDGRHFELLTFRVTVYDLKHKVSRSQKTRIGEFLEYTRIEELPQLINLLRPPWAGASLMRSPRERSPDLRALVMLMRAPMGSRLYRHRRRERHLTVQGFERLLVALSILGAVLVVGNEVFSPGVPEPSLEKLGGTQQADPGKLDDILSQLARAGDQLKTSQNRVGQLENELTQSRPDLDATRKGAENIRSSAASANAERPISQATVGSSSGPTTNAVSPAVSPKARKPNLRGRWHKMEAAGPRESRPN